MCVPTGRPTDAACRPPSARCDSACAACAARNSFVRLPWPYFFLPSLRTDVFPRIFHALALIGLRRTIGADFRRDLTHQLLVDAGNGDHRRLLADDADAGRDRIGHVMAEAQLQLQILALHRRAIADAVDFELLREALRHADDEIVHQRAATSPTSAVRAPRLPCGVTVTPFAPVIFASTLADERRPAARPSGPSPSRSGLRSVAVTPLGSGTDLIADTGHRTAFL